MLEGGRIDRLGEWIAYTCCALSERQPTSYFLYGDDTEDVPEMFAPLQPWSTANGQKLWPEPADFNGFLIGGKSPQSGTVSLIITQIRNRIAGLVTPHWTNRYTINNMPFHGYPGSVYAGIEKALIHAGYPDGEWLPLGNPCDARIYKQIEDVIGVMRYVTWPWYHGLTSTYYHKSAYYFGDTPHPSLASMWASAAGQSWVAGVTSNTPFGGVNASDGLYSMVLCGKCVRTAELRSLGSGATHVDTFMRCSALVSSEIEPYSHHIQIDSSDYYIGTDGTPIFNAEGSRWEYQPVKISLGIGPGESFTIMDEPNFLVVPEDYLGYAQCGISFNTTVDVSGCFERYPFS